MGDSLIHTDAMYSGSSEEVYNWYRSEAPSVLQQAVIGHVSVTLDDSRQVVVLRVGTGLDAIVFRFAVSDASGLAGQSASRVVSDVLIQRSDGSFVRDEQGQGPIHELFLRVGWAFEERFKPLPRG